MPTIEISKRDLEALVGKKFAKREELCDAMLYVKGEIEGVEGDLLKVDIKDTNRPDLWSVEGIARELRGQFGKEGGVPEYSAKPSGVTAAVDAKLAGIRPKAAYAVAKNVRVTDDLIKQAIQLQEKICQTYGRKRNEVAIGVFDFDKVHGNVRYFAAPWGRKFVPLGYKVEMSLREILKEHPKGIEYRKLIADKKYAPLLVDEKGEVLSMPPIINSEGSGKITTKTRNLFIDVTGHDQETINVALRILCMAFADRGAGIGSVKVRYGGKTLITPDFGSRKVEFNLGIVGEYSGLEMSDKQVLSLLHRARMNGKFKGAGGNKKLAVEYANYRSDILHPLDVVEDIIISYGYNRIAPGPVRISTVGEELPGRAVEDALRDIGIGLGLQEVLTFVLTSRENQEGRIGIKGEALAEIANPVSANMTVLRKRMFPELLAFLARNKHRAYPQRIFEIGKVIELDAKQNTGVREPVHLCIAICGSGTNFTKIKSVLDAITRSVGAKYQLRETKKPFLAPGRGAEIVIGKKRGILGEISKEVLGNFELEQPVCVLEIEV